MPPFSANQQALRQGFTLVELLVVIGIIGLLLSIILPSAFAIRDKARLVQCTANIRSVGTAILTSNVEKRQMPFVRTLPAPATYWFDKHQAGASLVDASSLPLEKPAGGPLACPADLGVRSYSMNVWASSSVDAAILNNGKGKLWKLTTEQPSQMILVIESFSWFGSVATGWLCAPFVGAEPVTAGRKFGAGGGMTPYWAGRFDWVNSELDYSRHRSRSQSGEGSQAIGRLNIAYADGHVALKSHTELAGEDGRSTGDSKWFPGEVP